MQELPSEAPVDDDEAFASSVEDDNVEINQTAGLEDKVLQAIRITTSEEVEGETSTVQACLQTGSGECLRNQEVTGHERKRQRNSS